MQQKPLNERQALMGNQQRGIGKSALVQSFLAQYPNLSTDTQREIVAVEHDEHGRPTLEIARSLLY